MLCAKIASLIWEDLYQGKTASGWKFGLNDYWKAKPTSESALCANDSLMSWKTRCLRSKHQVKKCWKELQACTVEMLSHCQAHRLRFDKQCSVPRLRT